MTIDLKAIRARDVECIAMVKTEAMRDRRALLAAYDALLAAVRKVTCYQCENEGGIPVRGQWKDCPDCADLRRILEGER